MVYEPLLKIAVGQHTWLPLWPRWALCNYIHLVLTAKRSLFDCQHLIIPRDTRGEPRATAASSGTIFLQRTAPSSGFPERLGSLPLLHSPRREGHPGEHSQTAGCHFYIPSSESHLTPSSGCQCGVGICSSFPVGLYHVEVQGAMPTT